MTDALFEAVYDRPDDDAPRVTLAEALKKRGDPRGTFIEIQLRDARGEATDDERAQADALLKIHRSEWTECFRVEGVGYGIHLERWERGFPVHGFATVFYPSGPRAWRTVRSLVVDMDTRYHCLRGPLLENLRALTWDRWHAGHYGTFCREVRLPKLETLRWCGPWQHGSEPFLRGLDKLSKFKHLTTLGFDPALVASEPAFWENKIIQRLSHLELADQIENAGGCVALAEGLPRLETLTLTDKTRSSKDPDATFALVFRRGRDRTLSIAEVETLRAPIDEAALAAFVSQLEPSITVTRH